MEQTENENKAAGAASALNVELERSFWVWWKRSGWKGNSEADAALEAWMESAKAEREACAKVCEDSCTNHGKRKRGSDTGDAARKNCAVRIRMRSN